MQQKLLSDWQNRARDLVADGILGPTWFFSDTLMTRGKLNKDKAAGGQSSLVCEMLKQMPWGVLEFVHASFRRCYRNQEHVVGDPWEIINMILIPKQGVC